jgi:hypothetical protein
MFFPSKMNKSPGEEGDRLRHQLLLMLILHLMFLIFFEIWFYENFVLIPFIMSFVYIYFCFIAMMTLKKGFVFLYVYLML